jgi:hypothetical protein
MNSDRYERVITAANLSQPDRVPWSVWAHYPAIPWLKHYSWELANRNGEHQARAHMALLNALDYKMDLLKVTPFARAHLGLFGYKEKSLLNPRKKKFTRNETGLHCAVVENQKINLSVMANT